MDDVKNQVNYDNIPDILKAEPRWVTWRYVVRASGGKPTKVPHSWGRGASSTDPHHWITFPQACAEFAKGDKHGKLDGIGFVLGGVYGGIDVDDCLDADGKLAEDRVDVLDAFATYREISPSGKGVKGIFTGAVPRGRKENGVECYSDGRFFTVTGNLWGDTKTVEDCTEAVEFLWNDFYDVESARGPTVKRVYSGDLDDVVREGVRDHLAGRKGTQEGRGADKACFKIVSDTVHGFELERDDALDLLLEWGERDDQRNEHGNFCPWTAKQLLHKIDDVVKAGCDHAEGPGWLLRPYRAWRAEQDALYDVFCRAKPEQTPTPEQPTEQPYDNQGDDGHAGDDPAEPQPEVHAEPQPEVHDDLRNDPWYAYLWQGHHGRYVTDKERSARIKSIGTVRKLIPETGLIPAYIKTVLPTTDADVFFHAAGAITLVAHLLNRRAWVRSGFSRTYPNLWVACVGASSTARKSSSINPVRRVLEGIPAYSRTVLPDTFTVEGLASDLGYILDSESADSPPEIECQSKYDEHPTTFLKGVGLFHSNEIGGFLANLDRNYNGGGKQILTEWYDCPRDWTKRTRTQGTYYVWRPCVSILGASTISWLNASCSEDDLGSGFLPRWLFFCGHAQKDYHLSYQDSPSPEAESELYKLATAIADRLPGEMRLSQDALDHYDKWQRQFIAGVDRKLLSWANRMIVHALKIAMVYQASVDPAANEIDGATLEMATGLVEKLAGDLGRLMDYELGFGKTDGDLKRVLHTLQQAGAAGIDHSALTRRLSPLLAWQIRPLIDTLAEQGRLRCESVKATNGKVTARYYLSA